MQQTTKVTEKDEETASLKETLTLKALGTVVDNTFLACWFGHCRHLCQIEKHASTSRQ